MAWNGLTFDTLSHTTKTEKLSKYYFKIKSIFIYETLPEIITRVIPREIGQNDKK